MVVLVNRGTAGPAELVAAALLDNKRADLVGEKTFGEGAQQKTFELPDGAALILSVAKYESPSGKKLQDDGVTPGVLVASDTDDQAPAWMTRRRCCGDGRTHGMTPERSRVCGG